MTVERRDQMLNVLMLLALLANAATMALLVASGR